MGKVIPLDFAAKFLGKKVEFDGGAVGKVIGFDPRPLGKPDGNWLVISLGAGHLCQHRLVEQVKLLTK